MKLIRIITKHLPLATVAILMAACASEDFVGDERLHEANENAPIRFDGEAEVITRATSNTGTTAHKLDGQFKIYGVKSGATAGSDMQKVFIDYIVWYADNSANTTTSNSNNWEYVGNTSVTYGSDNTALPKEQTIKYWDYSAADYRFVAGSPVSAFTFNNTSTTNPSIATATISGLAGHLNANTSGPALATNPVYVAKPKIIASTYYRQPVIFDFVRQQSQVRVGIYETIPGYIISEIHFYEQETTSGTSDWKDDHESGNNVILASKTSGYFAGGSGVPGTITYDWTNLSYTFTYDTGVTTVQNWYGGTFAPTDNPAAIKATSSNDATVSNLFGTDYDMAANGFFTVLPTPTATEAAPILIKCDYTLKSIEDNSSETIEVKGATAAIPAAFCKWEPNMMYTYLFKISDNTNGSTGQGISGLFPITFAAVESEGGSMGTTTIVSTPSITTYQEGSVVDQEAVGVTPAYHGIKYVTGKDIYVTVAAEGTGALLPMRTSGQYSAKVFYLGNIGGDPNLTEAPTEADLQLEAPTGTDLASLGENEATVGSTTLPAKNEDDSYYLTFNPSNAGYYAIQYTVTAATDTTPAVYVYKVVYVETAPSSGT